MLGVRIAATGIRWIQVQEHSHGRVYGFLEKEPLAKLPAVLFFFRKLQLEKNTALCIQFSKSGHDG